LKKTKLAFGIVIAAATWTSLAPAGYKHDYQVVIYTSLSSAAGAVGTARASADSLQYIGCSSIDGTTGHCIAQDSTGLMKMCAWSTAGQAAAVHSIGSFSDVAFGWDANGNCTSITVSNFSYLTPMVP
jgi:hypothetical protein